MKQKNKKRHSSFRLARAKHSSETKFLILIAGLFVLGGLALSPSKDQGNPVEESLAFEEDREGFWQDVKESSGDWIENAGAPILDNALATYLPKKWPNIGTAQAKSEVLGLTAEDGSEKWIDINLTEQRLRAWEGDHLAFDFWISSGKPSTPTVRGEFRVWRKVKYQAYRGGSRRRGDYYFLPNVPFSLFFYKGYAIHGAYWHNDFGVARRSHGCVNVHPDDAQLLWFWAGPDMPEGRNTVNATNDNPGVRIVVHE